MPRMIEHDPPRMLVGGVLPVSDSSSRYHYETHDQLRHHLTDFVAAYKFVRRLKILRGLTSYKAICKTWTDDPNRFILNPHHQSLRPNI